MAQLLCLLLALAVLVGLCSADIYMHNMRGSNNRLDSEGVNVGNERRLFDSQNNAKGGYNHGFVLLLFSDALLCADDGQRAATCTTMLAVS